MTRGPVPSCGDKATNVNGMKDVHVLEKHKNAALISRVSGL